MAYQQQPYQQYPPQPYPQQPQPYAQPYAPQYGQPPQQQYGQPQYAQQYGQPQYGQPAPEYNNHGSQQYLNPVQVSSDTKFPKQSPWKVIYCATKQFPPIRCLITVLLQDVWATILFLITLGGFVVCAYFGVSSLSSATNNQPTRQPTNPNNTAGFKIPGTSDIIGILFASVGTGLALSLIYFLMMQKCVTNRCWQQVWQKIKHIARRFAGKLIKITFILSILLTVAAAAFFFATGQFASGIIWLLFAGLYGEFFTDCFGKTAPY